MARGAKKFFAAAAAEQAAIEAAKPKSWEISPFNTLDTLLILALIERNHPGTSFRERLAGKPKRFLELAFKLSDKVNPAVLANTLRPILGSPMPFEMLSGAVHDYQLLSQCVKDFAEQSYPGLVIHQGNIYPVRLFGEDEETYQWILQNEQQVGKMIAHCTADALGLKEIDCFIMLFSQWGFSERMMRVNHYVDNIRFAFPDHPQP